ncbi:hypothetical protein J3Q64DRAFT_1848262 [Phycomyces blakesleeanus]|uniref:Uncharacterized protein n=1 Tax=Phycomyces blakesleeanus TaxID=4837 RepID=A0ABR3B125_PHYBL
MVYGHNNDKLLANPHPNPLLMLLSTLVPANISFASFLRVLFVFRLLMYLLSVVPTSPFLC